MFHMADAFINIDVGISLDRLLRGNNVAGCRARLQRRVPLASGFTPVALNALATKVVTSNTRCEGFRQITGFVDRIGDPKSLPAAPVSVVVPNYFRTTS